MAQPMDSSSTSRGMPAARIPARMSPPRFSQSLSIVLPAFNEEGNIARAVEQCLEVGAAHWSKCEVVVVDDGSKDDTGKVVREIAARRPEVRLISFEKNKGYGAALAAGFRAAQSDLVFFTDSDLQFDVKELPDLMPLLERADVVFGFRVYRYDSVLRCLLSWTYNRIVRVLFLVPVRDVDCSFKLFTRPVVDRLELESTDFFIDTEMVARSAKMGARVVEKGVRHYPRTAGHTSVRASHIPKTLWTVARMWFRIQCPGLAGAKRTPRLSEPAPSREEPVPPRDPAASS